MSRAEPLNDDFLKAELIGPELNQNFDLPPLY